MSMFDVRELTKPRPGFLYEPRVLWGQGVITQVPADEFNPAAAVTVIGPGRNDYYNGSKYPIVLTDVITLMQSPLGYGSTGPSLLDQLPIELGSLGGARYSYGRISGLVEPKASAEALESFNPITPDAPPLNTLGFPNPLVTPRTRRRSVTNLARWDFEHTLKLPAAAYLELQLSGRIPTVVDTSAVGVTADVNFYAASPGGRANWPGSTLTRTNFPIDQLSVPTSQFYYQAAQNNYYTDGGPFPFSTLPFQGSFGGTQNQLYPSSQVFTSKLAVQQKANYSAPFDLHGFSVGFDQTALDNALGDNQAAGPLSATTYLRARSRNGGTQEFWWRDGAPLAICTPTMTPGVVSTLSRPIALQPGEGFKLSLPQDMTFDNLKLPLGGVLFTPAGSTINIGQAVFYISFTGYAVVEA